MEEINQIKETSRQKSTLLKGGLIGLLILLLLIPTIFIRGLISERQGRKHSVEREIGQKWGLPQTINGPLLKIPFYENKEMIIVENGKQKKQVQKVLNHKYISPEKIQISSTISPEKRKRGIFEVVVYQSEISLNGSFKGLIDNFTNSQRSPITMG